jgi:hypothetical protein
LSRRASRALLGAALLAPWFAGCVAGEPMRRSRGPAAQTPDAGSIDPTVDAGFAPDARVDAAGAAGSGGTAALDDSGVQPGDSAVDAGGADAGKLPDACAGLACRSPGLCAVDTGGPYCDCDEGFSGADCDQRTVDYGRRFKISEGLADPDVIELEPQRYVLTGTGTGLDFRFLESSDLVSWTHTATYNPSTVDPSHDYCFGWAPDLVRHDGTLYLYFSAHRGAQGATSCPPAAGSEVTTYRAASVDGTLAFGVPELLFQGGAGAQSRTQSGCPAAGCEHAIRIDPTVYAGRLYYVYFDSGNNIASVSLTNTADIQLHTGPVGWSLDSFEETINEAPELLERGGQFHLFFSAAYFNSQYATFYLTGNSLAQLDRDLPLRRLTTPVRRGNGTLIETHGHNSVVTRHGETFNFFHVGVFDAGGALLRRDTYRQRIAWKPDGSANSQNQVAVSWNALAGYSYSLDLVRRSDPPVGPCIAVGRIGTATSTTYTGICPDAADLLVHKSEVQAFRLFASNGGPFVQVGEVPYDGYSDTVTLGASVP